MATPRRLPLLQPTAVRSSLSADGTRHAIHPADVHGKWVNARTVVYAILIVVWAVLPWIKIHQHPALFLDIEHRRFFLFGATFNAQDTWLMFFLLTGVGFALIYVTAVLGRVWCGWSCPQTVFLEGVYRRIERWVQGPREVRMRRNAAEMSWNKAWRVVLTHALYIVASFVIAHIVLSYFVSMPGILKMIEGAPSDHPEAFAWALAITGILYFNFGFFREQLCLAICPYGRLQSALIDADSVVVGYDAKRGEPRGKVADKSAGDCVECQRCVVVCPTGIDIRNGLQIDCIGCTACIDACDEIMDKVHRPRGLIRYSSMRALSGGKTQLLRPRIYIYTGLLVAGVVAASIALHKHQDFEANLLRLPGEPYVFDGDNVRDSFEVHIVNKTAQPQTYELTAEGDSKDATFILPTQPITLAGLDGKRVNVFVTLPKLAYQSDFGIRVHVRESSSRSEQVVAARFLGAKGGS